MSPITVYLTKYKDKYRGFITKEQVEITFSNLSDIKNLEFTYLHDYCMDAVTFKNFDQMLFNQHDSLGLLLKHLAIPYFKNELKFPLYVYLLAMCDYNAWITSTRTNLEVVDWKYNITNVVEWVESKCIMHSDNVNQDLLRTFNIRRHDYIMYKIKSKFADDPSLIEYIEDNIDIDRIEINQDYMMCYHQIYYKDTEGYTHGAMFYTHNDPMYNYFDQNVENLYA